MAASFPHHTFIKSAGEPQNSSKTTFEASLVCYPWSPYPLALSASSVVSHMLVPCHRKRGFSLLIPLYSYSYSLLPSATGPLPPIPTLTR